MADSVQYESPEVFFKSPQWLHGVVVNSLPNVWKIPGLRPGADTSPSEGFIWRGKICAKSNKVDRLKKKTDVLAPDSKGLQI